MNAAHLYVNDHYAYHAYKGNSEFMPDATRVKVIRMVPSAGDRTSMEAVVALLHDDGEPKLDSYTQQPRIKTVRARDILDRWENYESERDIQSGKVERPW